jgi:putative oxidoreductase
MKDTKVLIARILMAAIFLLAGFGKIMGPAGTMGYMASMGMPSARFLLIIFLVGAIIIELGGGLCILLGYKMKYAALAIFVFMIPVTLIFHIGPGQMIMFLKNMAIMGGLLVISDTEAGAYSIDGRKKGE